jgi:hypothetical protein
MRLATREPGTAEILGKEADAMKRARYRALVIGALITVALGPSGVSQAVPVTGQGTWETTLFGRDIDGNPLSSHFDPSAAFFYDSALNITWMARANRDNNIHWQNATDWANGMRITIGSTVYDDWRLPFVTDTSLPGCDKSNSGGTDCGYNVQTKINGTVFSELAHMFYETLGNKAYCPPGDVSCSGGPQIDWGLTNTGPFRNLGRSVYWSSTDYAPNASYAWGFNLSTGYQDAFYKYDYFNSSAWLVRTGDLVSAPVPVPGTLLLLSAGLAGIAAARWRDAGQRAAL